MVKVFDEMCDMIDIIVNKNTSYLNIEIYSKHVADVIFVKNGWNYALRYIFPKEVVDEVMKEYHGEDTKNSVNRFLAKHLPWNNEQYVVRARAAGPITYKAVN